MTLLAHLIQQSLQYFNNMIKIDFSAVPFYMYNAKCNNFYVMFVCKQYYNLQGFICTRLSVCHTAVLTDHCEVYKHSVVGSDLWRQRSGSQFSGSFAIPSQLINKYYAQQYLVHTGEHMFGVSNRTGFTNKTIFLGIFC